MTLSYTHMTNFAHPHPLESPLPLSSSTPLTVPFYFLCLDPTWGKTLDICPPKSSSFSLKWWLPVLPSFLQTTSGLLHDWVKLQCANTHIFIFLSPQKTLRLGGAGHGMDAFPRTRILAGKLFLDGSRGPGPSPACWQSSVDDSVGCPGSIFTQCSSDKNPSGKALNIPKEQFPA
jgi:hypothetical protein